MRNITAGTAARTVCLVLALTNQILTVLGYNIINISDDTVNTLITTGFTVIASIAAWWKNNSFTKAAIEADNVMHNMKEGKQ